MALSAEKKKQKLSEIQSGIEEAESLVNRCRNAFYSGDPLGSLDIRHRRLQFCSIDLGSG